MIESLRVAHLSTAVSWRGGEQQAMYLARGLSNHNVESIIFAQPESAMAARAREAGVDVEEVRSRAEYDPVAVWKLAGLFRKRNVTLVHAHDAHAVTLAAFAGRLAGVRRICTRRVDFPLNSKWKYRWGMNHVICISEAIRSVCIDAGVPSEMLTVVPSGIDLQRIRSVSPDIEEFRNEFAPDMKKRPLLLLNVASLTDHKGQKYLLEAMPAVLAAVPQTVLVIVGEGELKGALMRQANSLALDEHCVFAGFREDVPELLNACDLFVMSSHLEGLCTSVMDAMAAGRAVVSCRAGGLPELIEDGKTGLLVPPKDPKALGDALIDLLSNRKKRERFGRAAYEVARKQFDSKSMVEGTLSVYKDVSKGAGT